MQKTFEKLYQFSNQADPTQTIKEIEDIEPILKPVADTNEFKIVRTLTHSFEWVSAPGRNIKYFVQDKPTGKYLGMITLASDVSRLPARDMYLGWSRDNMFQDKKLNSSCIAQTIVPVQPLGYNVLGGKLCAMMCANERIRKDWKSKYGDELVGMTTTSLYGSYSMYQNIPVWKKVGKTKGTIVIKPDDDYYFDWLKWLRKYHQKEYNRITQKVGSNPPTSVKQKIIKTIFRKLNIKMNKYQNEQSKGVYYLPMYDNTKEYMQNKITANELQLSSKMQQDKLLDWWKSKAIARYVKLHKSNQLNEQVLWYEDLTKRKVQGWLYARGIKYI